MKNVFFLLILLLTSCASYTPGKMTQIDTKEKLGISAQIDSDMSFDDLTVINFYFSNPTTSWTRIKNIELLGIENHPDIRVIVGKDLYYWAKSMEYKVAIDNHNRELFWGSMALVGAAVSIAGSSSNSMTTVKVGAALAVGSLLVNDVENILEKVSALERASLVPESHLYTPFSIPPHLVTTKWMYWAI